VLASQQVNRIFVDSINDTLELDDMLVDVLIIEVVGERAKPEDAS